MNAFQQLLRDHKIAIYLAILTSIIVTLPQLYFRIDHKDLYQDGIQAIELLPDSPWSIRVREVQDGHNLGSMYYKDGKEDPYLFQPLGSQVVAYMGKIFSLDINNTILLSRIVLPFVTFLLLYSFVFLLSGKKFVALAAASVLLLADSVLSPSGLISLLQGVSPDNFLRLARPVNPAMIYILLFGFLTTFWLFYKKQNWRYGIASAIILGLNFYNYFYSWTYLYAFGGILVLFLLFQKKLQKAIKIASVFLGALILAIPYIINLYSATLYKTYAETSQRFGVIESHALEFVGFTVIVALIIFFWGFPKEDKERYLFSLALLLTPFITLNQQLLTGKLLQEAHYHWFFHKPMAYIIALIVVFYMIDRFKLEHYKRMLIVLIVSASFAVGLFNQVDSYYNDRRDGENIAIERQRYGPAMDWLNKNAEKESVVLANSDVSHVTIIYTPLNLFYHRAAIYSLSSTKSRLHDTLFTLYRLRGVGAEGVREVLFKERDYVSYSIYGMYYRELGGSYETIPDEKIEETLALYEEVLLVPMPEWFENILAKYEVEYLIWDKKVDPMWQLGQYLFIKEVVVFGDIAIYEFSQNSEVEDE